MYSTCYPSSSGSYSALGPWFGGVSWVLLRPTSEIFAVPPRAPEVVVHSAHWNRDYSLFILLVPPQPRPVHSRWLAPHVWNGLPLSQRLLPRILSDTFYFSLSKQGWTGVPKAARENVRNGPKFAKTIYLSIDNRPSKLRFGTALVLRMSSGVNLGEVVDPGKKIDFSRQIFENLDFFQALSHTNFHIFRQKLVIYSCFWANYSISLQKSPLS